MLHAAFPIFIKTGSELPQIVSRRRVTNLLLVSLVKVTMAEDV